MKKLLKLGLGITFAFIMMLSLTGCGNTENKPNNDNGNASGQKENNKDVKNETNDLTTVEGYLAQFGYSTNDFKFTKDFTRVGYASRVARGNVLYVSEAAVFQSARKNAEEKQTWLEDFVKLAKTKADDGKVYGYDIFDGVSSDEYVAKYNPDDFVYVTYMAYKLNGKTVTIMVSFQNGLDNEDPDEADYFVGIEFEFMKTY